MGLPVEQTRTTLGTGPCGLKIVEFSGSCGCRVGCEVVDERLAERREWEGGNWQFLDGGCMDVTNCAMF